MAELRINEIVDSAIKYVFAEIQEQTGMTLKECYEKQIPKKPTCIEDKMWCCPKCYNNLMRKWKKYPTELNDISEGFNYCMSCGQRLYWSDLYE